MINDSETDRKFHSSTFTDHLSLATVTLDNTEESQFRAVIWSVLFAMAEESPSIPLFKLAYVEIPVKLFESFLNMMLNSETGIIYTCFLFIFCRVSSKQPRLA